jgi:hypothetical protein
MPTDLDSLRTFLRRAQTATLLVAADLDGQITIQRLTLHQDIAREFIETARAAVPDDPHLLAYDPGYKPEAEDLLHINLADVEGAKALIADLQRVDQAELFQEDEEIIRCLRFYAIVVGSGGRQAVFLRHYSPKRELHRGFRFALTLQRGSYDRLRDKVFLFDGTVDCFSWDGILFIQNVTQFQRIFDYFEGLRRKARTTLQRIHARVPIANLDELEAAVTGNSLMLGKLAAIERKPYLPHITFADAERTIQEFGLAIQVVSNGAGQGLVFDSSREGRWLILKLLDDDYLGSTMTRARYEVNSKLVRQ